MQIHRQIAKQRRQHHAVRFGKRQPLDCGTRRDEFVAGGDDRDTNRPVDLKRAVTGGGGEPEPRRRDPLAGSDQPIALAEIEPLAPRVAAARCRTFPAKHQPVAITRRFFLDQHGIGTRRESGAGEDAHRFTRCDAARIRVTSGAFADHAHRHVQIVEADRIAVHR